MPICGESTDICGDLNFYWSILFCFCFLIEYDPSESSCQTLDDAPRKLRPPWLYPREGGGRGRAVDLAPGLRAQVFAGAESMLSLVRIDPHSEGVVHQHSEEQWGYLLEGRCLRIQGGEEVWVEAGDFWHTPAHVPHGVRTEERHAVILDIFSPPRRAYLRGATVSEPAKRRAVFAELAEFGAALLCDAAGKAGALPSRIQPMYGGHASGPAFTVVCPPGDNLPLHRAVDEASPGDVLVVSTGGAPDFGYWGDLLNQAARQRALGGLVLDGCVRDGNELEKQCFPIFAVGRCIVGTSKDPALDGRVGRPIRCGGSTVRAGDLVVADADGVVVVPAEQADAVLAAARRCQAFEDEVRRRRLDGVHTGQSLAARAPGRAMDDGA